MKSPYTGEEMTLRSGICTLKVRGETFVCDYSEYVCPTTGESFQTFEMSDVTLQQAYGQYNAKHKTNIGQ